MAKAGRVQHWKHGWIPVSPEALAFTSGKGPRPTTPSAPNAALGMPIKRMKDDRAGGVRRAAEIRAMLPYVNPTPHYQFPSQDMPGHHTGGVVISASDANKIIDRFQRDSEGTASAFTTAEVTGTMPGNFNRGSAEMVANRRARRIKALVGLEYAPRPEYQPAVSGELTGKHKAGYTGGLIFDRPTSDDFIRQLNKMYTGPATAMQARRMAGLGD